MANYLNNNQKVPSLFEEAMQGRVYDEPREDENNKPKTNPHETNKNKESEQRKTESEPRKRSIQSFTLTTTT